MAYRLYVMRYSRKTSRKEIVHLLTAFAAITFAFTTLQVVWRYRSFDYFLVVLPIATIATLTGFVVHELAHKISAIRYGYWAEFRLWNLGLLITIISPLLGFLFAAPGAVVVSGYLSTRNYGKISLAGPLSNVALSLSMIGTIILMGKVYALTTILYYVAHLNMWLALFNLIPFPPLDGYKVLMWSKGVWIASFSISVALYVLLFFL